MPDQKYAAAGTQHSEAAGGMSCRYVIAQIQYGLFCAQCK